MTTAVAVETLVRWPHMSASASPSSELSECRGLVKLSAVLTGVEEEDDEEEEQEEVVDRWEEEEEEGPTRSEEDEEEEAVLGRSLSGLPQL